MDQNIVEQFCHLHVQGSPKTSTFPSKNMGCLQISRQNFYIVVIQSNNTVYFMCQLFSTVG